MRRGCWRGNVILVFKYMKDCYCFRDTDSSEPSLPDHFPGPPIHSSLVAQMVKNLPAMQGTRILSMDWEDPLEKGMATHSYSCLENSMDKGAWWATVHGVAKSWT